MALFGRELELKQLVELIDGVGRRGGALVVRGEAGIGKSALLAEAGAFAASATTRVLTSAGVPAEQHLPFAGLHQLLYPVRSVIDLLPAPQRGALRVALGLAGGEAPEVYLVGLAVLNLLTEVAADTPLVLVVEDAQWTDRSSVDVLAFVARRLESEPVVLIATVRDDEPSGLDDAGLPSMTVPRLPEDTAAELLDAVAPGLAPSVRTRVLAEAAGNPLALIELPRAVEGVVLDGTVLPLTERLERAFAARVAQLPPSTRTCLLVAALDDSGSVEEILDATASVENAEVDASVLEPARRAGLVDVTDGTLTFRHPLMRSAIPSGADARARTAARRGLVSVLGGQPDRQLGHRAASVAGTDDEVAGELELAADRARLRGDVAASISAWERAARLSGRTDRRAERLLRAADLAVETGRRDVVDRLLAEAGELDLSPRQRARATWILSGFDDGLRDDAAGPGELASLAGSVAEDGDPDLAMRILWGAGMRCFWAEPGPGARHRIMSVARGLPIGERDPRMVAISAYVTPIERGASVVDRFAELDDLTGADPSVVRFLGSAALQVGAFASAVRFSSAALPGLRAQGRLGLLTRTLAVQAWSCVRLGDLTTAVAAAEEAARLAHETGQPFMYGLARAVQAEIAALRGDHRHASALAEEAERVGLAAGARPVLATAARARGLIALGEGRYDDALAVLRRIHDTTDPAYQLALRCYVVAELAEAAVRANKAEATRPLLDEMEELALVTSSPALHIGLRYARAVLAGDEGAEALFRAALDADLAGWPLERGRVQLAFGEWLRRHRRAADSRPHLRAARETFDALGVAGWSERARQELRAAGETSPRRDPDARDQLTAHELSIARLAADGLTNREIGQRLYLSHRTVSTHLHRIFPKLGISARGDIAAALRSG
ncbi:AAA family ATPase [Pseudonocardia spinosispora]|uniref:AAA family ATPase n=1 Tax=Pseudonocardia spinosispora TaxID=103441 RepID=UPI000421D8FD|nr:LuxR family transcriptional regulator [Pseudonocardia spinosispora]